MLLMDYTYIRGEYLPYYSKRATWNLLHAYIDAHSQRLIDEYPWDGVQAISRLQSQYANVTFSGKVRYNRLFKKVIHRIGQ